MSFPINNSSFESFKVSLKSFTDPVLVKNRIITQADEHLKDIASSKSWKLITYYRKIKFILWSSRYNFFVKLWNVFLVTIKFLGLNKEDTFDPDKLAAPISCENLQEKLFKQLVLRNGKIAVILHLYYVDLWEEIVKYLSHIQEPFDLFISIPRQKDKVLSTILETYPQALIYFCSNRGRDVAPFVEIYSSIVDLGYSYICKIHTKKSRYISTGDNWRLTLLDELLGSEKRVNAILNIFRQCPDVGMLVPTGYLYSALDINTMTNMINIQRLHKVLNISRDGFDFEYPAGSMFWCRVENFKPLSKSRIQAKDFPPEHGQLDNTLAHALERYFGLMVLDNHQYVVETSVLKSNNEKRGD